MTPTQLAIIRDRIIAERGWTEIADKIADTKYHSASDQRSIVAHELRQCGFAWKEIATCLGFNTYPGACSSARRHEQAEARLKLARQAAFDKHRAERYGMTI